MQIITWSAYTDDDFDRQNRYVKQGGGQGLTKSSIYDPKTGNISAMTVSNTKHDMFCPGIAFLPNGDVVVTGGQNADRVSIYDLSANVWRTATTMGISRGYGSTLALSNGKVRAWLPYQSNEWAQARATCGVDQISVCLDFKPG